MKVTISALLLTCGILAAQDLHKDENTVRMAAGAAPVYRVSVTARTAKAINYRHRSGATKIDFRGTDLMPRAHGEAKVESKQGYIEIEVEFDNLQPANIHGAEYLTYVLWAVTPEGRTANLGEILLTGTRSKLNVTTEMQVFGLIVTAEPYFSVTRPSDLIALENVVRSDTKGKVEEIDAKYELLQRGQYQRVSNVLALQPDPKVPLELYEARNAVQIARSFGAETFAAETFGKAAKSLAQAEAYQGRKAGRKPVAMTAREAVQMAEDSRAIAVKRQEEAELAAERQQSVDREARSESERVAAQAEAERVKREAEVAERDARADANRVKLENDTRLAAAAADADRLRLENEARATAAASEVARLRLDNEARLAAAAADAARVRQESDARASASAAEADRLRRENEAQRAASQAELDRAARDKAKAEADKVELRAQLLSQFNAVLKTHDSARGLIVNMSDVLFDSGKSSLRSGAREKLAKVAGILSGHPGLKLDVEGHTDNVGSDVYNQRLSEDRGAAVRDYLTREGLSPASVTSKGFGETQPVATNDSSSGRQQNRRVELVISGEIIGGPIGVPVAAR